jgi:hypothetical protein
MISNKHELHVYKKQRKFSSKTCPMSMRIDEEDEASTLNTTKSVLNSWYRQQGDTTKAQQLNNRLNLRLPKIKNKSKKIIINESTSQNRLHDKEKLPQIFSSNSQYYAELNADKNLMTDSKSKANYFYQKCIDDVVNSNRPELLKLSDPKELLYVRELYDIKYTTYGFGKSFGSVWNLEIFKV